jgi:putative molybdopterin biosynthesis protein
MAFEYLTNEPLSKAVSEYLAALVQNGLTPKGETVAVTDVFGRVTFEAVYAKNSAPHYNACAMDGIALDARLTFGATETTPVRLSESQIVRVDTGDPLPANCDCVIMIEDVIEIDGGVELSAAAVPWQHVRQIGEDISAGDMILPSFSPVTPSAMGAMLASGVLEIAVVRKPLVGIIPTGDEIVLPTANPAEGEIIEFNSTIFSAMLQSWGVNAKTYPIARDRVDAIEGALREALVECDAVLLNAGSSAGREDYSTAAIRRVGEVLIHGIAIKPGKPAILGLAGDKPILGIPGYPVSGIIVLEQIFKPVAGVMTGQNFEQAPGITAYAARAFTSSLKYREFIRTRVGYVDGKMIAVPLNRGAGVVSSFVKADGIIDIPQNSEGAQAGEQVMVRLLRSEAAIKNMVVVTGSHDPLIDEISDILAKTHRGSLVASSHVGSMGGIMAIRRGEAHLGGIHLLDEATGEYNVPYIKKYLDGVDVALIRCVQRVQGLMVRKENPKGIREFADIAREGVSYVNRQKGSGTRILCDYLAKGEGMDTQKIYGYHREEYTHTGVAAIIAAGSADTGLGIYSAAKYFGLDFIPICEEQYDLLFSRQALSLEPVQRFLEALRSDEFAARLKAMGGYTVEHAGEERKWI